MINGVRIKETLSGNMSYERSGMCSTKRTYVLLLKEDGLPHGKTIWMDHHTAYNALQAMVFNHMSPHPRTDNDQIFAWVKSIDVTTDKSDFPVWRGTVTWEAPDPRKGHFMLNPVTWSHRMTGGTEKRIFPVRPQRMFTVGTLPPFMLPAIHSGVNWDQERRTYEGAEVHCSQWNMTAKQQVLASVVTSSFLHSFYNISNTVNNDEFRGFPKGSLLYLGAELDEVYHGSNDPTSMEYRFMTCDINHQFIYERPKVLVVNGNYVGEADGHDVIWFNGIETQFGTYDQIYCAPMYHESNFSLLGLG